ncbi:MAG: hypothetical protein U5J99_15135 [Parvularculaceae bacterium]|nr:hypothetical protein [Parvularculaceae bacterium]
MAQRPSYDLMVIGADAAGLAAAAAANRLGGRAVVLRAGSEPRSAGLKPSPPNFVWRLLELHRFELKTVDAGLALTHLAEGERVPTHPDSARTARLLAARDATLEHFWPDFLQSMARAKTADPPQTDDKGRRVKPASGLALIDRPHASAIDILDDRFADEGLKAHVLMTALAPLGLAGDEPGSAAALFDFEAAAAPRRVDAEALQEALTAAAKDAGAIIEDALLVSLTREGERLWIARLEDGAEIRAVRAIASSALVAEAAGILADAGGSPLRRQGGVEATIRLRYAKKPRVKSGEGAQTHHIVTDKRALARARDAMLEGRIDDAMPMSFEVRGREIVARAPFAPASIRENGGMRDWTGQDLQILGRAAAAAIGRRLDQAAGAPQSVDAVIGPDVAAGLRKRDFSLCALPVPAPCVDAVGAATSLVMKLMRP